MPITENILSELIYLDSEFISLVFENITKESPKTYFSKTQGKKGDINDGIFSADILSNETKSFTKSAVEMLKDIYVDLEKYPNFSPDNFKNYEGTQTVWFNGEFTMGEWTHTVSVGNEVKDKQSHIMYEIQSEKHTYALLAQPQLFTANIGSLISASPAIRRYIGIPTKTLGRVLYFLEDGNRFVTTPYLIIEAEKSY
jgi:hypothetical protein